MGTKASFRGGAGIAGIRRFAPASLLSLAVFLVLLAPLPSASGHTGNTNVSPQDFRLRLYHTHTGERIDIVYRRGANYLPDALLKLNSFLRDHRTGEVRAYDPRLFDVLNELAGASGRPAAEIDIICGYRTPWSNEFLRSHTSGVARNSLHMQAEAIDLRLPGIDTLRLRNIALSLHRGGVGYYPHSDFIHVDVGRVRQWCFGCALSEHAGD